MASGADIQLKLRKGMKLSYELSSQTDNFTNGGIGMMLKQNMYFTQTVKNVDADGLAEIEINYSRIVSEQKIQGREMSFDTSKAKQANMLNSWAMAFVKHNITMWVDRNMNVKKIKGVDKILEEAMKTIPDSNTGMKQLMKKQLKSLINDDNLKQMAGLGMGVYPGKNVNVGDKWSKNHDMKTSTIPLNVKFDYDLKKITDDNYVIGISSTINSGKINQKLPNGLDATIDLKGAQTGEMVLDKKDGYIKSMTSNQKMQGKIMVNIGGQKQTIPTSTIVKSSLKLVK